MKSYHRIGRSPTASHWGIGDKNATGMTKVKKIRERENISIAVGMENSETDSIKSEISSKTPRVKKDSTKRRHQRHHKRQPGEQQFPIQVVTGYCNF